MQAAIIALQHSSPEMVEGHTKSPKLLNDENLLYSGYLQVGSTVSTC
jgi:hypothetical protein